MMKNDQQDALCLGLRNVRVAISASCNFNCVYCDGPRSRQPGKPGAMEDFRRTPLSEGVISTDETMAILQSLYDAGFRGIALTGGETFLNREWDVIVQRARDMGMQRVGVTTNGALLSRYIEIKKRLPEGLTLLTLSLDTTDSERFKEITGRDQFNNVINGLKEAKRSSPGVRTRVNKVVLKSDMSSLLDYIKFCEQTGAVDDINLLNLVFKEERDRKLIESEFISAAELLTFFAANTDYNFTEDVKHEYISHLSSGMTILIKDTNQTMRNEACRDCPIYCQEGYFTVRVATDGTITACPDYESKLPYIDGRAAIKDGTLFTRVGELVDNLRNVKLEYTLDDFFRMKNVHFLGADD